VSNSVKDAARDRSGRGLPPKSERRALGKAAAAARARAKRRRQLLRTVGSGAAVVLVVGALAVGCTLLNRSSTTTPAANSSTAPSASPTATQDPIDPAFDPQLHQRPVILGSTGDLTTLVKTLLVTGPGAAVQNGQTLTVNYVGAYYGNGNVFDSSWDKTPFSFKLGDNKVIKGWDQGLVGVPVGSRVQLDIPTDLAYGPTPPSGYPAGPLRFVIDVLAAN
jgi:peptidylprolyl isomerase